MTGPGPPVVVTDPADPRLVAFTRLTDAELRRRVEAEHGLFVVEGILAIERLLTSTYRPHSFLLTERALARLGDGPRATGAPVYIASPELLRAVVGFELHRGAVAAARRPAPVDPAEVIEGARRLLVVEGVNDAENLGSLFRNAAAFGVDAVLLDPTCADPLYRRAVRVSMGHVLAVPFARLAPWPAGLEGLRRAGVAVVALTPHPEAEPIYGIDSIDGPVALVVGAEGPGLHDSTLGAADLRVRIPMAAGVDSLNVATAAAVALHRLAERSVG